MHKPDEHSRSLLNNNSSVDLIVGTNMDRSGKANHKSYQRVINEEASDESLSTLSVMKNNIHKIQNAQNSLSNVNSSNIVLPKLDNSFSSKQ